jgi:DNA mismatch repair protein MutL
MSIKSSIKPLSKKVYDRIAAGEVIDRPSSILRELIDNALDSGADEITINLAEGGNEGIEVIDNGTGMNEEEVKLCCKPFTTSKIKQFEDLFNLDTYGFRGEALNSISTVSRVEIVSKTSDEDIATIYFIEGGEEISLSKGSRNTGTTVSVNNIFFNIPARKKSMKSAHSEYLSCKNILLSKALPNHNVSFMLYNNGEKKITIPGEKRFIDKLKSLHDKAFCENLIEINTETNTKYGDFTLKGYVGNIDFHRPNRSHQHIFINSRPIFSPAISKGLQIAYRQTLPRGRFPVAYLFLDLPKDFIDINVHPAKKEIKFIEEGLVVSFVISSIREALNRETMIPSVGDKVESLPTKTGNKIFDNEYDNLKKIDLDFKNINKSKSSTQSKFNLSYQDKEDNKDTKSSVSYKDYEDSEPVSVQDDEGSHLRIIGTLFNKYILIEKENEFILIDQHIAHKRLNYEKLKVKFSDKPIESQTLMFPLLIDTIEEDVEAYFEHKDKIKSFGFDFDKFGSNAIALRIIPDFIDRESNPNTIKNLLDNIVNNKITTPKQLIEKSLSMKAGNISLKGGDAETRESLSKMIKELFEYTNPFLSVEGKPSAIKLEKDDIEKLFK